MKVKRLTLKERIEQRQAGAVQRTMQAVMKQLVYMICGYAAGYVIMMAIALVLRG